MGDRRERLHQTRLYLIVTVRSGEAGWLAPVSAALASGRIGMVQLRAVASSAAETRRHIQRLHPLCRTHDTLLLLNDEPALAAELDLDGAHVGQGDLAPAAARALLGPERLLGLSTHDVAEIEAARSTPVDYLGLGPCFSTGSKALTLTPGGAALVARCHAAAEGRPLFPIGGITPSHAPALAAAGAQRLAVGAGVLAAGDPAAAAVCMYEALPPAPV